MCLYFMEPGKRVAVGNGIREFDTDWVDDNYDKWSFDAI